MIVAMVSGVMVRNRFVATILGTVFAAGFQVGLPGPLGADPKHRQESLEVV